MIQKADVVVIGSGGLGAATAFSLSKRGGLSIALVDKHDIGSQTSPRAAGMVSCVRKGDLMITLIKDACRKIESFTEETGQPLDWVHSGSLKIARRQQDAEVIKSDFERGRRMGLDVELISPDQASHLNPFLKPMGVVGAMRIDDDDVDLDEGVITVKRGKNGKARFVPIAPSSVARLRTYRAERTRLLGPTRGPFFLFEGYQRPTDCCARYNFALVSQGIGLRETQRFCKHGRGPRIHDLRHTFAVRTILGWYRKGIDPDREMIKLSTYLGHSKPDHTYWYIEAVPELLQLASKRAERSLAEGRKQ